MIMAPANAIDRASAFQRVALVALVAVISSACGGIEPETSFVPRLSPHEVGAPESATGSTPIGSPPDRCDDRRAESETMWRGFPGEFCVRRTRNVYVVDDWMRPHVRRAADLIESSGADLRFVFADNGAIVDESDDRGIGVRLDELEGAAGRAEVSQSFSWITIHRGHAALQNAISLQTINHEVHHSLGGMHDEDGMTIVPSILTYARHIDREVRGRAPSALLTPDDRRILRDFYGTGPHDASLRLLRAVDNFVQWRDGDPVGPNDWVCAIGGRPPYHFEDGRGNPIPLAEFWVQSCVDVYGYPADTEVRVWDGDGRQVGSAVAAIEGLVPGVSLPAEPLGSGPDQSEWRLVASLPAFGLEVHRDNCRQVVDAEPLEVEVTAKADHFECQLRTVLALPAGDYKLSASLELLPGMDAADVALEMARTDRLTYWQGVHWAEFGIEPRLNALVLEGALESATYQFSIHLGANAAGTTVRVHGVSVLERVR
jgi:hypothetical protein